MTQCGYGREGHEDIQGPAFAFWKKISKGRDHGYVFGISLQVFLKEPFLHLVKGHKLKMIFIKRLYLFISKCYAIIF